MRIVLSEEQLNTVLYKTITEGINRFYPNLAEPDSPEDTEVLNQNKERFSNIPPQLKSILLSNGWKIVAHGTGTGKIVPQGKYFITVANDSGDFTELINKLKVTMPELIGRTSNSETNYIIL